MKMAIRGIGKMDNTYYVYFAVSLSYSVLEPGVAAERRKIVFWHAWVHYNQLIWWNECVVQASKWVMVRDTYGYDVNVQKVVLFWPQPWIHAPDQQYIRRFFASHLVRLGYNGPEPCRLFVLRVAFCNRRYVDCLLGTRIGRMARDDLLFRFRTNDGFDDHMIYRHLRRGVFYTRLLKRSTQMVSVAIQAWLLKPSGNQRNKEFYLVRKYHALLFT